MRAATAWNVLDRSGVPGITDVWCPPVQAGINALVRMQQSYRGQAKQAANALWGSTAAHVRYKHVTVVDDDIDIHDYAAVDWAIAYRVNAGENDIVIMPGTFGLGLDPSTRRRDRNPALFGTGKWNRVLIDATMNLDYDPDPDLGGARFPPTVWPNARGRRRRQGALERARAGQAEAVTEHRGARRDRHQFPPPACACTAWCSVPAGSGGRRAARRLSGAARLRRQLQIPERACSPPGCSASSAM